MQELIKIIEDDLDNAYNNQKLKFLGLSNKKIMSDLRECTGEYLELKDTILLQSIRQWKYKKFIDLAVNQGERQHS